MPTQPRLAHITEQSHDVMVAKGSNHTHGVAVDLMLIDAQGQAPDMGAPVDTMRFASHHFHRKSAFGLKPRPSGRWERIPA